MSVEALRLSLLKICIQSESVICSSRHDTHALVLAHSLLEEVGLALQWNILHEVKRILHSIDLEKAVWKVSDAWNATGWTEGTVQVWHVMATDLSQGLYCHHEQTQSRSEEKGEKNK